MGTVVLHFHGGPRDGSWARASAEGLAVGQLCVVLHHTVCNVHTYISKPWNGVDIHLTLYHQEVNPLAPRIAK